MFQFVQNPLSPGIRSIVWFRVKVLARSHHSLIVCGYYVLTTVARLNCFLHQTPSFYTVWSGSILGLFMFWFEGIPPQAKVCLCFGLGSFLPQGEQTQVDAVQAAPFLGAKGTCILLQLF